MKTKIHAFLSSLHEQNQYRHVARWLAGWAKIFGLLPTKGPTIKLSGKALLMLVATSTIFLLVGLILLGKLIATMQPFFILIGSISATNIFGLIICGANAAAYLAGYMYFESNKCSIAS